MRPIWHCPRVDRPLFAHAGHGGAHHAALHVAAGRVEHKIVRRIHRGRIAKHGIFRNGICESQFRILLQCEFPLIKHALKEYGAHNCKLTLLVSQKMHNIRLFERIPESVKASVHLSGMKGPNWNIKPGTVVDTQVTHPEQSEFYLATHSVVQGTTRTPRYTLLIDESQMSMDQIQQMCNSLAFCHKITNKAISLPAPVYIAKMYAKRGRDIYNANRETIQNQRDDDGELDYQAISERFGYADTELHDQRVNA